MVRRGRVHTCSQYVLNVIVDFALAVCERLVERDEVVFRGHTRGHRHGGMVPKSFFHDHVEVWEGLELVHSGVLGCYRKELITQLALHVWVLCEGEEAPHGSRARGFVPSDNEPANG